MKVIVDISGEDLRNLCVLSAAGDDDVGILFVIADVLVKHGLDSRDVLGGDVVDLTTTFIDIALDAAKQTDIRFDVHIELKIHHRAETRIIERMDAFHDDDVVRLKVFASHICAAVVRIIIALFGDALTF